MPAHCPTFPSWFVCSPASSGSASSPAASTPNARRPPKPEQGRTGGTVRRSLSPLSLLAEVDRKRRMDLLDAFSYTWKMLGRRGFQVKRPSLTVCSAALRTLNRRRGLRRRRRRFFWHGWQSLTNLFVPRQRLCSALPNPAILSLGRCRFLLTANTPKFTSGLNSKVWNRVAWACIRLVQSYYVQPGSERRGEDQETIQAAMLELVVPFCPTASATTQSNRADGLSRRPWKPGHLLCVEQGHRRRNHRRADGNRQNAARSPISSSAIPMSCKSKPCSSCSAAAISKSTADEVSRREVGKVPRRSGPPQWKNRSSSA